MVVFFFNDTATIEIYTLSLPDALPIGLPGGRLAHQVRIVFVLARIPVRHVHAPFARLQNDGYHATLPARCGIVVWMPAD